MQTTVSILGGLEGWLKMFARNKIKDPSVNRVETIRNYLNNISAKG